MKIFGLFVFLISMCASSVVAEPFKLSLVISNVYDLPDARARVFIYTSNGSNQPGLTTRELGPSDRNSNNQFELRVEGLNFSNGEQRGFIYADVLDGNGDVVRRVPITYYDDSNISSLRWLNFSSPALQALASEDRQFRDSYPNYLNGTSFDDENSDFLLLVYRTMITKGFVTNERHWTRLFEIFRSNVRYFGDGGIDNISRILTFLEDRYDQDKGNEDFVDFYLELLSRIMVLDLGGRSAPGFDNLEDYIVARISIVFSDNPVVAMGGSARALLELYEDDKTAACFRVSLALLKTLALNADLYEKIEDGSLLELDFKRVLKRAVDCSQRIYVTDPDSDPDSASPGNLAGGVAYLSDESEETKEMLRNFYQAYNQAELLFPRREDGGDWRQIYQYYDIIREAGVITGEQS